MSNKGHSGNFFEDFEIGARFPCPTPRVITDADCVAYIAHTGDRSPLYCNAEGLVHPLIVFHTVLGQTVRQISLNAVANLGYAELLWRHPVRTGDEISTEVEIIGLKENTNRESGIVYVRTEGKNQRGEDVLSFFRWVMVRKRRKDETPFAASPVVPILQQEVSVDRLQGGQAPPTETRSTGGRSFFEDYVVGEDIDHVDGMTINASDHMNFTRLYQNSARVHFDALATGGKPLVYGGLVLSIGYAQSFSGLEQRGGIRAINAGTHANPVYSGDTLYTLTQVLEKHPLGKNEGALRLRMVVLKNERPRNGFDPWVVDPATQKRRYQQNVVLDLDYWESMARRSSHVA